MKKLISISLIVVLCFSLVGCGSNKINENTKELSKEEQLLQDLKGTWKLEGQGTYLSFSDTSYYTFNPTRDSPIGEYATNISVKKICRFENEVLICNVASPGQNGYIEIADCKITLDEDIMSLNCYYVPNDFYVETTKIFAKYSKDTSSVKDITKFEPKVGMNAKEVELSTWGKPNDINKTTTSNIVSEQWVYNNNKYVYLDNGIVTAIQE